jgi:hypothetical protein
MNLNAAALRLMAAKGLSLDDVAEIVAANEVTRDPTAAERQARCRARKRESQRDVTRDPLNEEVLNPGDSPKPNGFAPAQKTKSVRQKGTRLPNDWALPDDWRQWAKERRHWSDSEISEEAELFANYWQAKSGAGACHTDWFKTWRNWCIRSHRKDGIQAGPPLTPEQAKESAAKTAEFYERIGRPDDAAELRRRYALPVSSALPSNVTNLLRQGAA